MAKGSVDTILVLSQGAFRSIRRSTCKTMVGRAEIRYWCLASNTRLRSVRYSDHVQGYDRLSFENLIRLPNEALSRVASA